MLDKKSLAIIGLIICLVIAVGYIAYGIWFTNFVTNCRQEGMDNTLQGMVNQITSRGTAIQIKVGQEQLICSTVGLLNGVNKT